MKARLLATIYRLVELISQLLRSLVQGARWEAFMLEERLNIWDHEKNHNYSRQYRTGDPVAVDQGRYAKHQEYDR